MMQGCAGGYGREGDDMSLSGRLAGGNRTKDKAANSVAALIDAGGWPDLRADYADLKRKYGACAEEENEGCEIECIFFNLL